MAKECRARALARRPLPPHASRRGWGLWYPIIVSVVTFVVGTFFLHETKNVKIHAEHALPGPIGAAGAHA